MILSSDLAIPYRLFLSFIMRGSLRFQIESFPIFEIEQLIHNFGSKEALNEMLTIMLSETELDLRRMEKAFSTKDYALVEKLAHKIKGGALYLGMVKMKYACQYVERYWKTGQNKLFERLYLQMIATIEQTAQFIKNWMKQN
jgi:HPt (histidine-containing phosphotransfer) domain-containing protein